MRTYDWWKKQKRRVQKKYTLFLGRYYSPKEVAEIIKRRKKKNEPKKETVTA